ncbi:SDR family oxidoreductase [Babesia caballi]|uniref:SDR family oxidoreductase n=1 Tax=Babesia caballi TaxID=5871 RepID=A0AAV4LVN0_BABCB|nr:SDR family oxidoreductase [Babesia caballi]
MAGLLEEAAGKWSRQTYRYNLQRTRVKWVSKAVGGSPGVKATPGRGYRPGTRRRRHVRDASAFVMSVETWIHSYTDNGLTRLTVDLSDTMTVTGRAGGGSRRGPELRRLEGRSLLTVE